MANENYLAGMVCPECGSLGPFHIAGLAVFEVHDSGTDSFGGMEWDKWSFCKCVLCGCAADVQTFTSKEDAGDS